MQNKYGVARHVYIPLVKRSVQDFAVSADWTPAAGDVKISKDGGAFANVTNLPTAIASANTGAVWDFSLTATEMQAKQVVVVISDAATKAVEDQMFLIETYGNASAQVVFDLDQATPSVAVGTGGITTASFAAGALNAAAINANTGLIIRTGTAQAGAAGTVTLDAGASATDSLYVGAAVVITGGTGAGQVRMITAYVGSTKVATVTPNWTTNPDNTSTFSIIPARSLARIESMAAAVLNAAAIAADTGFIIRTGTAQAGAGTSITLDAGASATTDFYKGAIVVLTGGTGAGQHRVISAYNGGTKVATVGAWATNPDATSTFAVIPARVFVDVLNAGLISSSTYSTDAIDANALATSAVTEFAVAVWAQAMTELVAVPGVTASVLQGIEWIFLNMRNKITATSAVMSLRNDADNANIGQAPVSDDNVTFVRGEFA